MDETKNDKRVSVVGSEFIRSEPLDLMVEGDTVTDMDGNKMFKVKTPLFGLHNRRVLSHPTGESPIATMKMKVTSKHDRWLVFRGNSAEDLIFTAKRSSTLQLKTKVEVFLKQNPAGAEGSCDFTIKGRFMKRASIICAGDSERTIAQVHEADHKLLVTVYPNVDYAFIVTLVLVFDLINTSGSNQFH
ncbi:PREDICTED: protein LURP-one-related 13 [Tarenaya hassleriana]|uniref:protein LURP-one-related 13 n=1 Tax=Tarenaya hassleriana TaxID=28532 RepID=UPI00053C53D0|nr:PREDICTED: protein LURP-one-related 13 [Tarenaya hassleriana]